MRHFARSIISITKQLGQNFQHSFLNLNYASTRVSFPPTTDRTQLVN